MSNPTKDALETKLKKRFEEMQHVKHRAESACSREAEYQRQFEQQILIIDEATKKKQRLLIDLAAGLIDRQVVRAVQNEINTAMQEKDDITEMLTLIKNMKFRLDAEIVEAKNAYQEARTRYCNAFIQDITTAIRADKKIKTRILELYAATLASNDNKVGRALLLNIDDIIDADLFGPFTADELDDAVTEFKNQKLKHVIGEAA